MAAKLIPVSDSHSVAADEFAQVKIDANRNVIAILRDGQAIQVTWGYGRTPWQLRDELVTQINNALE